MSDDDPTITPVNRPPSNVVPVVSQTQSSSQSSTLIRNQQTVNFNTHDISIYHDLSNLHQSPAVRDITVVPPLLPSFTHSLELNNTTARRRTGNSTATKRNASRERLGASRKKAKKTFNPDKSIFSFLCKKYVTLYISSDRSFVNKKSMLGNWQRGTRLKSFKPFKMMDPILKGAPNIMNQNMCQLILKDFMRLKIDTDIICLILVRSQLLERRVEVSMDPPFGVCSSYGSKDYDVNSSLAASK